VFEIGQLTSGNEEGRAVDDPAEGSTRVWATLEDHFKHQFTSNETSEVLYLSAGPRHFVEPSGSNRRYRNQIRDWIAAKSRKMAL
jgi:hypothetical protein